MVFFQVVLLSAVSAFGLIGNISAILVFSTMKRQLKFHRLMMMLSGFDLIYVVLSFMLFALPKVSLCSLAMLALEGLLSYLYGAFPFLLNVVSSFGIFSLASRPF